MKEWSAIALLTIGVAIVFTALIIPPPGEIHESVIYIFAQILIYAGSVFGISAYAEKLLARRTNKDYWDNEKQKTI